MFFDIQCVELFSIIILETGSGAFFGSALPTKAFFGSALPTKLHCSSRILKARRLCLARSTQSSCKQALPPLALGFQPLGGGREAGKLGWGSLT